MVITGKELRAARKSSGLTINEFAKTLSVPTSTLLSWETTKVADARTEEVAAKLGTARHANGTRPKPTPTIEARDSSAMDQINLITQAWNLIHRMDNHSRQYIMNQLINTFCVTCEAEAETERH